MNIKKALAFIMVLALIFSFAGCKKSPSGDVSSEPESVVQSGKRDYITLLYSAADTFNPYTAKTDINRQLCKLLYEPLVKLDNEFEPVFRLAESVETEGKKCTVKLKSIKFSDNSSLTADDVVYSFKLAKNSGSLYASKLYIVDSATAADSNTVVFTLSKADPYFVNLLDFPIIKSGSDNITDSDSVLQPPIGCGRYKVKESRQGLEQNLLYYGEKGSIKEINLINAPDSESVAHYVEVGAADMYYSEISDGNIIRMSGKKLDINLNNLIYIGINQNYDILAESSLRQAISSGIDRSKLCQNAYYNNAVPATGFFNPVWNAVKSVQNIQIEAKSQITVENLEKIGYNRLDSKGIRKNAAGVSLKFTMLVNSENRLKAEAARLISKQLLSYGISITVVEKPYSEYLESLKTGDFQLFLGEIKLTDNMDISCMVTEGGTAAYGLIKQTDGTLTENDKNLSETEQDILNKPAAVVSGFYEGKNTIADVALVLQTEMPFIPVCYRTGALFCNDNIENVENCSASDIYFSIESYIYNN